MNVNILKPGKAVESCFEKPNILLAVVLVLLPTIAYIVSGMLYGVQILDSGVMQLVLGFVKFFTLVLVVLAMGLLFDSKKARGKIAGLFSALALIQIIGLLAVLLSALLIPIVFSQDAIGFASKATMGADQARIQMQVQQFVESNPDAVNLPMFGVSLVIAIILLIWGFYLGYLAIKRFTETKPLTAIILALIAFTIMGALPI